jgi:hypothetical protein
MTFQIPKRNMIQRSNFITVRLIHSVPSKNAFLMHVVCNARKNNCQLVPHSYVQQFVSHFTSFHDMFHDVVIVSVKSHGRGNCCPSALMLVLNVWFSQCTYMSVISISSCIRLYVCEVFCVIILACVLTFLLAPVYSLSRFHLLAELDWFLHV